MVSLLGQLSPPRCLSHVIYAPLVLHSTSLVWPHFFLAKQQPLSDILQCVFVCVQMCVLPAPSPNLSGPNRPCIFIQCVIIVSTHSLRKSASCTRMARTVCVSACEHCRFCGCALEHTLLARRPRDRTTNTGTRCAASIQ